MIAACHFPGPIVHDFSTVDTQGFCQRSTPTSFIIDESQTLMRIFLTGLSVLWSSAAPFDSWLLLDGLRRVEPRSVMPPAKKALIHLMLHVLTL